MHFTSFHCRIFYTCKFYETEFIGKDLIAVNWISCVGMKFFHLVTNIKRISLKVDRKAPWWSASNISQRLFVLVGIHCTFTSIFCKGMQRKVCQFKQPLFWVSTSHCKHRFSIILYCKIGLLIVCMILFALFSDSFEPPPSPPCINSEAGEGYMAEVERRRKDGKCILARFNGTIVVRFFSYQM